MPELSRCVQKDGKLYCWDSGSGSFVLVDITPVGIDQIPADVITAFMKDRYPAQRHGVAI